MCKSRLQDWVQLLRNSNIWDESWFSKKLLEAVEAEHSRRGHSVGTHEVWKKKEFWPRALGKLEKGIKGEIYLSLSIGKSGPYPGASRKKWAKRQGVKSAMTSDEDREPQGKMLSFSEVDLWRCNRWSWACPSFYIKWWDKIARNLEDGQYCAPAILTLTLLLWDESP